MIMKHVSLYNVGHFGAQSLHLRCGLQIAGRVLCLQGYPDQALQRTKDALALARELSHPFSLAFALAGSATILQQRREVQALRKEVEAGLTLATEQGFPRMISQQTVLRGWLLAEQGNGEEGISQILEGRANAEEQIQSNYGALLAEAYLKAGRTEKGLNTVAETPTRVHKTAMNFYEAELHRIKGELLLAQEGKIEDGS